jgi:ABC-type phosphate/phosphonate transport system substrate-binding protein
MGALTLGAVAYDAKVVTIWEGFRAWLRNNDFDFDFVLYSHYERQVDDLIAGRIDVAWNSPLAWVRTRRIAEAHGLSVRAAAMRDTDRDLVSAVIVRADSPLFSFGDLAGRTVGTGAVDSPQATLLPLDLLRQNAVDLDGETRVRRFDIGVGLHGDHIGGERDAAVALMAGDVDASCLTDGNLLRFSREGTITAGSVRVIGQTVPYDHCNMSEGPLADRATVDRFVELLLAMEYSDEEVRPLLDLEGLTKWLPGRTEGYVPLEHAVDASGFYSATGEIIAVDYRP